MSSIKVLSIIFQIVLCQTICSAQQADWKEMTTKGGQVLVKYLIYSAPDSDGDDRVVAKYSATTDVSVELDAAEKFLRNSDNHKKVLDNTEVSKNVGAISKNEWLQYLYMDIPWPMPNADCVQQVTVTRTENELIVSAVSKPDAYPMQGEKRMDISDMKYHFVRKGPGIVELTISGHFAPIGSVSKFLLETWFPKGPEQLIERLIDQVNSQ